MRLPFGLTITRTKSTGDFITNTTGPLSPVGTSSGWWPVIKEGFAGAWQRSIVTPVEDAATHPTFWACLTLIAGDIAKCRPKLVFEEDGIRDEVDNPAYSPIIRRPNHYQNRIQFYEYWILSKLTRGNTYVLKERDNRGVVTAMYLLDPSRVRPMITPSGHVYYWLSQDFLSGLTDASLVVPAREMIHDRWNTLYHPLCGLSPVYACGATAGQALTIMNSATKLFRNGSQIGGVLTAPGQISAAVAQRIETHWKENFSGEKNIGAVPVLGDGLHFDRPPVMSAVDAQLIDQLKWDDEKICATLHVPPYMASVGALPSYNNVEALGQQYYGQCLQTHFESIELCLTEGLELKTGFSVEFDIEALDRMDSVQRMEVATKGVVGGILSPNEGRKRFNKKPVPGGNTVYLQRQNWPLEKLGSDMPQPTPPPAPQPQPEPSPIKAMLISERRASLVLDLSARMLRKWAA